MNTKFNKQNIKHELKKLIKRLAENKCMSQIADIPPQSEELRRIRERNQFLRDEMIRRSFF